MNNMEYLADKLVELFGSSPETGEDFTCCEVDYLEDHIEIVMSNDEESWKYTILVEEI